MSVASPYWVGGGQSDHAYQHERQEGGQRVECAERAGQDQTEAHEGAIPGECGIAA
jgi:hypothetical protein